MSPPDQQQHDEIRYEDDTVPRALLLRVCLGTIVAAVVLSIVAYLLLELRVSQLRPSGSFPEAELGPPHRVAEVREDVFELPRPRPELKDRQRARLESWGWIDRARGVAHIPIEQAIESVLEAGERRP